MGNVIWLLLSFIATIYLPVKELQKPVNDAVLALLFSFCL